MPPVRLELATSRSRVDKKKDNENIVKVTLGTCGLNSTALCMASTAVISAVLRPRFEAMSGENLGGTEINLNFE